MSNSIKILSNENFTDWLIQNHYKELKESETPSDFIRQFHYEELSNLASMVKPQSYDEYYNGGSDTRDFAEDFFKEEIEENTEISEKEKSLEIEHFKYRVDNLCFCIASAIVTLIR